MVDGDDDAGDDDAGDGDADDGDADADADDDVALLRPPTSRPSPAWRGIQ
jgi:hypothetical protein